MAVFALVHGAWHGGWCWEEVTPLLEAAGHRAYAPDLPGLGEDRTPLAKSRLRAVPTVYRGCWRRSANLSSSRDIVPAGQ